jgi:CheY-like chemotaxis protein
MLAEQVIEGMPPLDLILSDVLMPGRTGPEMVAGLRASHPEVPALFVTGFAGAIEDAALRGERVLRKPFTLAALDAAISEVAGG